MKKNYGCILAALILLTACGQKKEDSVTTVRPVKTARVESRSENQKRLLGHCRGCGLCETGLPRERTDH